MKETIVTGRKFRRLADEAQNLWQRISFWTKASDLEFDDGKTAEAKVGGINGITSDISCNNDDIASSIKPVHDIKSNLDQGIINNRIQLVIDDDGNLGWKKDGADTVIPFKRDVKISFVNVGTIDVTRTANAPSTAGGYYNFQFNVSAYNSKPLIVVPKNNQIGTTYNGFSYQGWSYMWNGQGTPPTTVLVGVYAYNASSCYNVTTADVYQINVT